VLAVELAPLAAVHPLLELGHLLRVLLLELVPAHERLVPVVAFPVVHVVVFRKNKKKIKNAFFVWCSNLFQSSKKNFLRDFTREMEGTTKRDANILITGTPGTGKTTLSELVASSTGLRHINVTDLVKEKSLHEGKDEEFDSYILDEDKVPHLLLVARSPQLMDLLISPPSPRCVQVCDELEDTMTSGGNVVDFHTCDFFPERWFDLVVVLRTDNSVLYPRLVSRYPTSACQLSLHLCYGRFLIRHLIGRSNARCRSYKDNKIQENIECEIMQVVLDEARESYKQEIVVELTNNTVEEMESNAARIQQWLASWRLNQQQQ
jgi:adenylate kinase